MDPSDFQPRGLQTPALDEEDDLNYTGNRGDSELHIPNETSYNH